MSESFFGSEISRAKSIDCCSKWILGILILVSVAILGGFLLLYNRTSDEKLITFDDATKSVHSPIRSSGASFDEFEHSGSGSGSLESDYSQRKSRSIKIGTTDDEDFLETVSG